MAIYYMCTNAVATVNAHERHSVSIPPRSHLLFKNWPFFCTMHVKLSSISTCFLWIDTSKKQTHTLIGWWNCKYHQQCLRNFLFLPIWWRLYQAKFNSLRPSYSLHTLCIVPSALPNRSRIRSKPNMWFPKSVSSFRSTLLLGWIRVKVRLFFCW